MPVKISQILSRSCLCITFCHLSNLCLLLVIVTQIWQFRVFSPVSTHLGCITPAPVVHFKISSLRIHLIPCTVSIAMIRPKHHTTTTKGVTQKVAPTHSPPAAPDVAKKRKPPKICKDIPWSPTKVVRRKLALLPDTTIDLKGNVTPLPTPPSCFQACYWSLFCRSSGINKLVSSTIFC